ncbi:hypothetical protein BDY24DRAFT_381768 [Mrakia frigida]|uniref:uncharacterized protein n=1 Tax=Mrakia frigida TaxID=29902 RepID=UPI003FCC21A1
MLRSFSRAGRSVSGLSLARLSLRSSPPSVSSSSPSTLLRQTRWTSSSPSPGSSSVEAPTTPAPSTEIASEATDAPEVDSSPPTATSTPSAKPKRRLGPPFPAIIRLPPHHETFDWASSLSRGNSMQQQMKSDSESLKLSPEDEKANLRLRKYFYHRVGTSAPVALARRELVVATKKAVESVLDKNSSLVVLGSVAQETDVNASITRLGIVVRALAASEPETPQERIDVLKTLIEPLKASGIQASFSLKGEMLECMYTQPNSRFENPPRPLLTLGFADKNTIYKNALYASYSALSPAVLVPLIRSVTGVELRLPTASVDLEELRTILCISYLQSLPSPPLLPSLQRVALVRGFNVPRRSLWQSVLVDGEKTSKQVEITFVPIGVSPSILERTGWMNGQQEVEFVRRWRSLDAPAMSELVAGFFHWYGGGVPASTFSWETHAVSVRGPVLRTELPQFENDAVVVLDPANPGVNLFAKYKKSSGINLSSAFMKCLGDRLIDQTEINLADLHPRSDFQPQSNNSGSKTPRSTEKQPKKPKEKKVKESKPTTTTPAAAEETSPLVAAAETLEAAVPQVPEVPSSATESSEVETESKPVEEDDVPTKTAP